MLSDIRDPSKRAGFASKEAFNRSYGKYRKDKPQHSPGRGGADEEGRPGGSSLGRGSSRGRDVGGVERSDMLGGAARMRASASVPAMGGGAADVAAPPEPPKLNPKAKWVAAAHVKINKNRTSEHERRARHAEETGDDDAAARLRDEPKLLDELTVRTDAVSGRAVVVDGDKPGQVWPPTPHAARSPSRAGPTLTLSRIPTLTLSRHLGLHRAPLLAHLTAVPGAGAE